MKQSLLASALTIAAGAFSFTPTMSTNFYAKSVSKSRRNQLDTFDGCVQSHAKDDLPRGYPGAKLARKAKQKAIAVKHPRGLRLNGVTV